MHDLEKISSSRLFAFWKDFCIGILVLMGTMLLAQVLPYYFAPIPSLIGAAVLYTMLYNNRLVDNPGCMVMIYALFYCLIFFRYNHPQSALYMGHDGIAQGTDLHRSSLYTVTVA